MTKSCFSCWTTTYREIPNLTTKSIRDSTLDEIQEPECKAEFRFNKNDIPVLAEVLGLPETFRWSQRTVANKLDGL